MGVGSQRPCRKFDGGEEKISAAERIAEEKEKRQTPGKKVGEVRLLTRARMKGLRGAVALTAHSVCAARQRGGDSREGKDVILFICVCVCVCDFPGVCRPPPVACARARARVQTFYFFCACLSGHNYLVIFVKVVVLVLQQVLHCLLTR